MGTILGYNIELMYVILITIIAFTGGILAGLTQRKRPTDKTIIYKKDKDENEAVENPEAVESIEEQLEEIYGVPKTVETEDKVIVMEKVEEPLVLDIEEEPEKVDEPKPEVIVTKTEIIKGW